MSWKEPKFDISGVIKPERSADRTRQTFGVVILTVLDPGRLEIGKCEHTTRFDDRRSVGDSTIAATVVHCPDLRFTTTRNEAQRCYAERQDQEISAHLPMLQTPAHVFNSDHGCTGGEQPGSPVLCVRLTRLPQS